MKKILILTLSLLTMFLYSCKKENEQEERKKNGNCSLTESMVTTSNETGKLIYLYDNTGKITKIKIEVDGDVFENNYVHSTNQIIETGDRTFTYKLDASGKIISSINSDYDHKEEYQYLYNSEGYIIETKIKRFYDTEYRTSEKYSYTNGNLTSISDGRNNTIITYGSELSSDNFFVFDVDSDFPRFYNQPLKGYFGKQSKNLASRLSYNGYSEDYIYQKDAKGNITKVSKSNSRGWGSIYINKYTCK